MTSSLDSTNPFRTFQMDDLDLDALFDAVQAQTEAARAAPTDAAPSTAAGALRAASTVAPIGPPVHRTAPDAPGASPACTGACACSSPPPDGKPPVCNCGEARALRARIGKLTRDLHESLKALRLDETLAEMAVEIPDARNRLKYVTEMCERSAQKVLDALDVLGPIHDGLRADAASLHRRWDRMLAQRERPDDGFMRLFEDTRAYLGSVEARTGHAGSLHTEIMMAQDFQDLTGQVCRKIEVITERIESQLIHMLIDTAPDEMKPRNLGMLEGPQVTQDRADAVNSQSEVDSLLSSLGF